jgi:hypothetical protein
LESREALVSPKTIVYNFKVVLKSEIWVVKIGRPKEKGSLWSMTGPDIGISEIQEDLHG